MSEASVQTPAGNRFARERRNTPRTGLDWFRTPAWATEALLEREAFPGAVWECAAGDGAMADPIAATGYCVVSTDVSPQRADVLPRDFLMEQALPEGCQSIITNPPFKLGGEFARHALALGARKIALIQRLAFLEGAGRERSLFRPHPPARVWVFAKRPTMWAGDMPEVPKANGGMAFAWIVWEAGHTGTQLGWIA
jgi:hypothetical protein